MEKILRDIGRQFCITGQFVTGFPYGSGHIHDTYKVTCKEENNSFLYIHQRINCNVFKDPQKIMENMLRVTEHQFRKLSGNGVKDISRSCLQLVPSLSGDSWYIDEAGKFWRTFLFIDRAHTCDIVETEAQAYAAGYAFAQFQKLLVDLPGARLHETIPDFHNTPKRYITLENMIESDPAGRVDHCAGEIAFVRKRHKIISVLTDLLEKGDLPERITHNDTKLNNVMLDDTTGEALCVIDLDTVMPGTVLYDFGDLVRTSATSAAEDEKDLNKIFLQIPLFKALTKGYLSKAREFLTDVEREYLVFSGKLITFEQGIRFLTDYLQGDTYYKTKSEQHNLDRCRNQFKLVESIEEKEGELEGIVQRILSE